MHILLTDLLTCPSCGPDHGLIVLADRIEDRRVISGRLGCANCRRSFSIAEGEADLAADTPLQATILGLAQDDERAVRIAALLGVTDGGRTVLVIDPNGEVADGVAAAVPDLHVLSFRVAEAGGGGVADGVVSRIRMGQTAPLRKASLAGIAVVGVAATDAWEMLSALLAPGARLVLENVGGQASVQARSAGLEVLLEQDGVVVATAPVAR